MASKNTIPAFPGIKPPRTAPAPPKYLVITDGSGEEKKMEVGAPNRRKGPAELHPTEMKRPLVPVMETRFTSSEAPPKTFDQPAHRFKRSVDSRAEGKGSDNVLPMRYVGTSYAQVPNAPSRGYVARPKDVTVPRPFMPLAAAPFAGGPALANRTANGTILGSLSSQRFVDPSHVPYLEPDVPIGPDNPSKDIDETWSGHWDDEVYQF